MITDASYFIFDDDKTLSRGLSNYLCNSSLSNEIILKLGESSLMRKLDYDSFHDILSLGQIISQRYYVDPLDSLSKANKRYDYLSKLGWNYHDTNGDSYGSKSHFCVHDTSYAILLISMWSLFVFKKFHRDQIVLALVRIPNESNRVFTYSMF